MTNATKPKRFSHKKLERNVTLLGLCALGAVAIGGIVEIAPLFWINSTVEKVEGMRPYTPLELTGRNIYMREGCYHLPQPDDPPVPRRGRTLWPLQPGGRKHVRPPVPVGIKAHRA